MKHIRMTALSALATLLLSTSACHPDQPATQQPAVAPPAATSPAAASPPDTTAPVAASPRRLIPPGALSDTLHLPGGRVALLRTIPSDSFDKLPFSGLPELANDSSAEHLPAEQGRITRQGLVLQLRPAQGPEVRLASTPDAQFTLQNTDAVRYRYWGSLPTAHQWAVRAWAWESAGTVLVDQRTGHRLAELPGSPAAAPDGRFVLFLSPGLGGGDQANRLSLVQIEPTGARLLWQIEPTTWEPVEARWFAPNRVALKRRYARPDGSLADDAPVTCDELILPR
ncbi:MAG: hypothetical protein ACRYG7_37170 [Janthinobacterium lividum]